MDSEPYAKSKTVIAYIYAAGSLQVANNLAELSILISDALGLKLQSL